MSFHAAAKQRRGGNDDNKAEEGEKGKHCLSLNDEPGTGLLVGIVAIAETMFGLHTHERLPHSVFPPAKAISLRSEGTLEEDCQWRFLEAENGKPPEERRERAKRREEDLEYMGWKRERIFPPTANRGTARRSKEEGCDTGTLKDVRNRTRKSEVKKTKSPVPGQNSHPSSVFVDISLLNRPTFEREASA